MLTRVTGRADCVGCACALQTQSPLCFTIYGVLMFMYYTVCYCTGIFYAVVRQISMLVIDNKDSVFTIAKLAILKSQFCVNSVSKSWSVFLQSSMIHQTCKLVAHIFVLCVE